MASSSSSSSLQSKSQLSLTKNPSPEYALISRYELEIERLVLGLQRALFKNKMVEDAVRLYEYVMNGVNINSREDCILPLRKVVVAKELDVELFSRVVKEFTDGGNTFDDSMLYSVLKSLTSGGRMDKYIAVLDAMVECWFRPSRTMRGRVAFDLSSVGLSHDSMRQESIWQGPLG